MGNQNGRNVEILTWGIISFETVESLIEGVSLFREKLDILSLSKVRLYTGFRLKKEIIWYSRPN